MKQTKGWFFSLPQTRACRSLFLFPLRFLLDVDVTGVSQSQSIHCALHLHHRSSSGTRRGKGRHPNLCLSANAAAFASKRSCSCAHFTHVRFVCASACLCMFCMRLCVFCSLLLCCHPSVCRLPKPEAPVGF